MMFHIFLTRGVMVAYDSVNRSFTDIHEFDGVFEACTHIDSLVSPISPLDSEQIEELSSYFMWENGSDRICSHNLSSAGIVLGSADHYAVMEQFLAIIARCEKEVDRIKKQFDDCMAFLLRVVLSRCITLQVSGSILRFGDLSRQATIVVLILEVGAIYDLGSIAPLWSKLEAQALF
ncbi:hypothetical protein Tco_0253116 [Tanacetum coccineum]